MNSDRSGEAVVRWAPAKVNLWLEVLGRRDDGYHEIETVMVGLSLCDVVRFVPARDERLSVTCRWAAALRATPIGLRELPQQEDNIAWRALDRLRRQAGLTRGGHLELVKQIPDRAGLGGGSSDAAAALRAAAEGWRLPTTPAELAEIAATVGSDVPFFLRGGAAVCRGRGERIEPLPATRRLWFLVVVPPEGLRTADVYAALHVARGPRSIEPMLTALRSGSIAEVGRQLHNRLEPAALQLWPQGRAVAGAVEGLHPLGRQMTGSGSAFFGLYGDRRSAARAARVSAARRPEWYCRVCHSIPAAWGLSPTRSACGDST